jgi:hypothetical protein
MNETELIIILTTGIFVVSYLLGYFMRILDALNVKEVAE